MGPTTRHHRQAGFTAVEAAVAASILSAVLLAGTQLASGLLSSTASVIRESSQLTTVTRSADGLVEVLRPVGQSTLWGTPEGSKEGETMAEEKAYDRIEFRTPLGYAKGEVQYEPSVELEPDALWFSADGGGVEDMKTWGDDWGSLCLYRSGRKSVVRQPVRGVQFVRQGAVLSLQYETLRDDERSVVTVSRSIHLQAR